MSINAIQLRVAARAMSLSAENKGRDLGREPKDRSRAAIEFPPAAHLHP